MGNRKSSPNMMGIAAITSKLSQQNVNPHRNAFESDEQQNKWTLSERDIAFLVSQTGKHKY
jgi:NACalpha-BTF3-like transcription factor